ncbi:MAG: PilC/PilY family type IV pilus protein [Thioalkalispiraceae bacterium]
MKTVTSLIHKASISGLVAMSLLVLQPTTSHGLTGNLDEFSAIPPTVNSSTVPLVMLVMSNDHQLFYKAYNDWSDLDGDGTIDSTYNHDIDYYGYFDSYKCYEYDSSDSRFEPEEITTDKYCTGPGLTNTWSGNFLNWATMTRMDVLRKVLYGGKRVEDDIGDTTLERAYLPSDAHSFAKFIDASAIPVENLTPFSSGQDLTFCNTTYNSSTTDESQDTTEPPLVRVAKGDFRYWAANERWQCTWDDERGDNSNSTGTNTPASAATSDPSSSTDGATYSGNGPDYIVRVEVCDEDLIGKEKNCKEYSTDNYKPTGVLHTHGENNSMEFGLLTGSYEKNKSGGVVRKNISTFTDELETDGDGNLTGQFDTSVNGIVASINKMRISRYQYSEGFYNETDNCPWGLTSFSDGDCSNWGNPASEMYLEAVRYFAGLSKTAAFDADDSSYIPGLTDVASWTDPLSSDNYCAACNIIVLNTSDFSYDDDQLDMSGLNGSPSATDYTDDIGDDEGISGNDWFVGETSLATDQLCTAKTISNLGSIKGLCPGAPRLQGTYNIAGIAHYAQTNDIRSDLSGTQKIKTYAVSLSPAVPKIEIPVPGAASGEKVSILPACRNTDLSPDANCAIVDFKVVEPHTDLGGGSYGGSFYVNWEDSEQGGDYDQDMKGTISYVINSSQITVYTNVDSKFGSYPMGFGYIISGTTNDGFRVHSGVDNFRYTDPDGLADCNSNCNLADGVTSQTYNIGVSSASLLKDPLWYAAKWGGFIDTNGDNTPDQSLEWDSKNNETGQPVPDGIPDTYFLVTNPGNFEERLDEQLNDIKRRVSSGTAAAVIADAVTMQGALVQAIYQPQLDKNGKTVTWSGMLHSVFIDQDGFLREDTNQNAALDSTDAYIKIAYSADQGRTQVWYCSESGGNLTCDVVDRKEIEELKSIWNARDQLAIFDATDSRLTSQRAYGTSFADSSNGGRYIFTWLDDDGDGKVDSGEAVDFTASNFSSSNYGYLNADDETEADKIVNFIRGYEDPASTGYRSRTIDYDGDNADEVWRLGDIVNSSPVIVADPSEQYDILQGDNTYTTFRAEYENRRRVIYVGGNDGMLHAFNGGFFDVVNTKYCTSADCNDTSSDHPLGAELWAYVPRNLLPHLRWQTEKAYPHVYYVDGEPRAFDVNIFPKTGDTTHPKGWGTILVVGMRLGGSPIGVDIDNADGDEDGSTNSDYTARSAYVIFDITDPEQPPKLLAEITRPDLGFTTSTPNIVVKREPDDNINWDNAGTSTFPNDWYLSFGTGPTDIDTVTSTQNAKVVLFKLNYDTSSESLITDSDQFNVLDTSVANSFVGDTETVHWSPNKATPDLQTDAIYFGIVAGSEASPSGRLMRVALAGNDPAQWVDSANWSTMLNTSQPFLAQPMATTVDGEWWIFTGTGRYFTVADNVSTAQQSYYGLKEEAQASYPSLPDNSVTFTTNQGAASYLQDVTDVEVYHQGEVVIPAALTNLVTDLDGTTTTFNDFKEEMQASKRTGWFFNFEDSGERNLVTSTYFDRFTIFSSYIPSVDSCVVEGNSMLYVIYDVTGTAYPNAGLLNDLTRTNPDGDEYYTKPKTDLGVGIASKLTVLNTSKGGQIIGQSSTGEIYTELPKKTTGSTSGGRQSWREIFDLP